MSESPVKSVFQKSAFKSNLQTSSIDAVDADNAPKPKVKPYFDGEVLNE